MILLKKLEFRIFFPDKKKGKNPVISSDVTILQLK